MALISCGECDARISDRAASCPSCGAPNRRRVKPFKWWLWMPLGTVALFLAYGASMPQHEANARAARRICEKEMVPRGLTTQFDCDRAYDNAMRGEAADSCPPAAPDCSWGKPR